MEHKWQTAGQSFHTAMLVEVQRGRPDGTSGCKGGRMRFLSTPERLCSVEDCTTSARMNRACPLTSPRRKMTDFAATGTKIVHLFGLWHLSSRAAEQTRAHNSAAEE